MRWHLIRKGRIVASDTAPTYLDAIATARDIVISDADWRGTQYRRALRDWTPPVVSMREKADQLFGGG